MSLFTGMAILEEHFTTAYFRFNDNSASQLGPDLRVTDKPQDFVDRWEETAKNLANVDTTRLLMTFSRMLPAKDDPNSPARADLIMPADQFLHARLQGTKSGIFDVYFDSRAPEQVQAGQTRQAANGNIYYDVWTSFSTIDTGSASTSRSHTPANETKKAA